MASSNSLQAKRFIQQYTTKPIKTSFSSIYHILINANNLHKIKINPFFLHLLYFLTLSLLGLLLLSVLPMKNPSVPRPTTFDLFFTSLSASTVSSMATVEMESFSNSQLILLTLLMLSGGEVFTSMLPLLFRTLTTNTFNHNSTSTSSNSNQEQELELGRSIDKHSNNIIIMSSDDDDDDQIIRQSSLRYLFYVVLGYLVLVHAIGSVVILVYVSLFPAPRALLDRRGIPSKTFAVFTAVSSFSNCGFIPTNDNMQPFRTCSGMLLIVAALVLLGNTMYPIGLGCFVWLLKTITKRKEHDYILSKSLGVYEEHLMMMRGWFEAGMLGATVCGFILVQAIAFGCLEWRSSDDQGSLMDGMNDYQKAVGSLFMAINSRHAGESIVDLSAVTPAMLVLYVVMMYLPPYTTFFPVEMEGSKEDGKKKRLVDNLMLSQLSYLAVFVIIICITERRQLAEDPLNFNVLNIVVEVISAYGNVGFTTGYSCKRRLKLLDGECRDSWVGLSGRWSNKGKLTLMLVMIFGRLKKFSMNGGKAWIIR